MKTKLYIIIPIILFISLIPNVIDIIAEEPSEEESSNYLLAGNVVGLPPCPGNNVYGLEAPLVDPGVLDGIFDTITDTDERKDTLDALFGDEDYPYPIQCYDSDGELCLEPPCAYGKDRWGNDRCGPNGYNFVPPCGGEACGSIDNEAECENSYTFDDGPCPFSASQKWIRCVWNEYAEQCEHGEECYPAFPKILDVKIEFDKNYRQDAKNNRLFIPQKPITPFDDVVCVAKIRNVPDASLNGGSLKGRLITKDIEGYVDGERHETILIDELSFTRVPAKTDKGKNEESEHIFTYESEMIIGWPNGWIQDRTKMEALIQNEEVICEVKYNYIEGGKNKTKTKIQSEPISLCVHLWGPDGSVKKDDGSLKYPAALHKFVTARTTSLAESSKGIVNRGFDNMINGYHVVEPFKYYRDKFAHYVDIEEYDDKEWITTGGRFVPLSDGILRNIGTVLKVSNCKGGRVYNVYTVRGAHPGTAHCSIGSKLIVSSKFLPPNPNFNLALIAVHETGHTFCYLNDEYEPIFLGKVEETNCIRNLPLEFLPYGRPYQGCTSYHFVRTSRDSIMRGRDEPRFNVWSCAYCRAEILKTKKDLASTKGHAEFCKTNFCKNRAVICESPGEEDYKIVCLGDLDGQCPKCQDPNRPIETCYTKNNEDPRDNECVCTECLCDFHCSDKPDLRKHCDLKGNDDPRDNECVKFK